MPIEVNTSSHPREAEAARDLNNYKPFRKKHAQRAAKQFAQNDIDGAFYIPSERQHECPATIHPPRDELKGKERRVVTFYGQSYQAIKGK